jgi:broad specificity polyphosphatase/5'/3'-nucleotidase SurE
MGLARYGEQYEKRIDPRGRTYFWSVNEPPPPPSDHETDLSALRKGYVTVTPLPIEIAFDHYPAQGESDSHAELSFDTAHSGTGICPGVAVPHDRRAWR